MKNNITGRRQTEWKTVSDCQVVTIWKDSEGNEVELFPCDFASTGVPIDQESGEDLEYVCTRVKM